MADSAPQTPATPRAVHWIPIPAGSQPKRCTGRTCGEMVYWAHHPKTGNPIPISIKLEGSLAPTRDTAGRGVMHHGNCPDVAAFRKRKRS